MCGAAATSAAAAADPAVIAASAAATTDPAVPGGPTPSTTTTAAAAAPGPKARAERPLLVYGELLGKGGPWGAGIEYGAGRFAIGAVVSAAVVRDQQIYTWAPYGHVRLVRGRGHSMFTDLGAAVVYSRIPSPVAGWDGTSSLGAGAIATLGWEHAWARAVVRAYVGGAAAGVSSAFRGGIAPLFGIAAGARL